MKRTIALLAVLVAAFAMFIPAAYAGPGGCDPDPGTAGNDTIVCNADDADGVNTGLGTDSVTITGGTVFDTIIAAGVQVTVVVNGGALDTTLAGTDAISMPNGGAVIFQQGSLTAGYVGIVVYGDGSVVSAGDIAAVYTAIFVNGDGSINNTGDMTVSSTGISYSVYGYSNSGLVLTGTGTVTNSGDITITYDNNYYAGSSYGTGGIVVSGGGTVTNSGNISVHYTGTSGYTGGYNWSSGITLMGGGTVTNSGTIDTDVVGIFASDYTGYGVGPGTSSGTAVVVNNTGEITSMYGIYTFGETDQTITNSGNIHLSSDVYYGYSYGVGIYAWNLLGLYGGNGGTVTVNNSGNIDGSGYGIYVGASGSIVNSGTITLDDTGYLYSYGYGIYLEGDGTIDSQGEITTTNYGIVGGMGDQVVDVRADVNAPLAVYLGSGNDTLTVHPFIVVNGDIDMGDGDDIVRLANHAVVNGTIYGGETGEVVGDLLVIGVGEVCASEFNAEGGLQGLDDLDPELGTTTYLGQTYTWAEFEMLGHEGTVSPCLGKIEDGRINAYDLGAPEALYCTVDNGVSVWELDLDGQGTFSFAVNKADIEAAFATAISSGVNTLIGSDSLGNELYALSDGTTITFVSPELREAGKTYMTSFERTLCG